MDMPLSRSLGNGLHSHLDRVEILHATIEQLRKDLAVEPHELVCLGDSHNVFEDLRSQVLPVLDRLSGRGDNALTVMLYRVDIAEPHLRRTLAAGGLHALAGEVVLRALQKVLTRMRFAGRF